MMVVVTWWAKGSEAVESDAVPTGSLSARHLVGKNVPPLLGQGLAVAVRMKHKEEETNGKTCPLPSEVPNLMGGTEALMFPASPGHSHPFPLLPSQLAAVHLVDSHYCTDPAKFISVLCTSLATMLHVELPHVNLLSKMDLIEHYGKLGKRSRSSSPGQRLGWSDAEISTEGSHSQGSCMAW